MSTKLVAEQFEISRRRVQQLATEYRDTGGIPELETPGRKPYATHPDDLSSRMVAVHEMLGCGAVAVAKVLRVRDDLSVAPNTVHEIPKEHNKVTENTNKQGRQRPWVRFERDHSVVTVHMDWFQNDRNQQVLAIEDDASRHVFDMIETDGQSAARSVELLKDIRAEYETDVPILEVITDHGSEFFNTRKDDRPCLDHEFERYLHEHDIDHSLCKVGRPQFNGKLERFF